MDPNKPGKSTTEFLALIILGVVTIASGLTITDGIVNYSLDKTMLQWFAGAVIAYGGGRSWVKASSNKPIGGA